MVLLDDDDFVSVSTNLWTQNVVKNMFSLILRHAQTGNKTKLNPKNIPRISKRSHNTRDVIIIVVEFHKFV